MGGHSQARRIGSAAVWSLLLGAGLAGAGSGDGQGLFPPQSTVVLLSGVPGDVESEESFRDQLQGWLEVATGSGHAAKLFVLCDDPQAVTLPVNPGAQTGAKETEAPSNSQSPATNHPSPIISHESPATHLQSPVTVLKGDRSNFLGLGQRLAGGTNALVVIAWGHGGRQGDTPVLHVRGPRITAADFKALAGQAATGESRWVLMFRGSGVVRERVGGGGAADHFLGRRDDVQRRPGRDAVAAEDREGEAGTAVSGAGGGVGTGDRGLVQGPQSGAHRGADALGGDG